jgi:S1-C subfamily serine protease
MRALCRLAWSGISVALAWGTVACGGSSAAPPEAPLISIEQERQAAEPPAPAVPTSLDRVEVDRVVDAGLGRFLQTVSVEADVAEGRFRGFRIVEVRPADAWHGVDLKVGDVVTAINGKPIERPEQAHEAFMGLKQADRLVVSYVRAGSPRELALPIIDQSAPNASSAAAPAKPAPVPGSLPEAPAKK